MLLFVENPIDGSGRDEEAVFRSYSKANLSIVGWKLPNKHLCSYFVSFVTCTNIKQTLEAMFFQESHCANSFAS